MKLIRSDHPPSGAIVGSAFAAHMVAKLLSYWTGIPYPEWAQLLVAMAAMFAMYRWG